MVAHYTFKTQWNNYLSPMPSSRPDKQKEKSYFYKPIYSFSLFLLPAMEKSDFYQKLKEKELAPVQFKASVEE